MSDPVMVKIDMDIWRACYMALVDARDNAVEILNNHMTRFGESKKDRAIQNMYEKEIERLDVLIKYAEENGAVPF